MINGIGSGVIIICSEETEVSSCGINKSLELTDEHFRKEFQNIPYKYFIYDSANLSQVRDFATSDQIRIMIINIQAFAQDMDKNRASNKRILLDYNDKLGAIPINLIKPA